MVCNLQMMIWSLMKTYIASSIAMGGQFWKILSEPLAGCHHMQVNSYLGASVSSASVHFIITAKLVKYTHACTCTCTQTYAHAHIHIHTHTHTHTHTHSCMHAHTHTHIHTHKHTHTHTHITHMYPGVVAGDPA